MAGGLSAGSVRATRRPRHVLPGGLTSLRSGALLPRLRLRGSRQRRAPTLRPGNPSYSTGPYLTDRQSEESRPTSQKHLWGQNGACPRPSEKCNAQAPSPFCRPIRICYGNRTPRHRRERGCRENWVDAGSSALVKCRPQPGLVRLQ